MDTNALPMIQQATPRRFRRSKVISKAAHVQDINLPNPNFIRMRYDMLHFLPINDRHKFVERLYGKFDITAARNVSPAKFDPKQKFPPKPRTDNAVLKTLSMRSNGRKRNAEIRMHKYASRFFIFAGTTLPKNAWQASLCI